MSRQTLEAIIERTLNAAVAIGNDRIKLEWELGVTTGLISLRFFEEVKFFNAAGKEIPAMDLFHMLAPENTPAFITCKHIE